MLRIGPFSLFFVLLSACAAEVSPTSLPEPSRTDPPATGPSDESTATPPATSASTDAAAEPTTGPKTVTLSIDSATYVVTQAGATTSAISVVIDLENDSAEDITAIDDMSFDFGGGKKVALNQPACGGKFPITAGATKAIEVRMVVSPGGEVMPAGFSMKCPSSQSFGAGDGTAPIDAAFSAPIKIVIVGKTKAATFTANGVATRSE